MAAHVTTINASQQEQQLNSADAPPAVLSVPVVVLESLAARVRANGLYLVMLSPDGGVAWQDASSGNFFHRYVLPLLQYPDQIAGSFANRVQSIASGNSVAAWNLLPGVASAAFAYTHKRQVAAVILLAGKHANFALGEDVLRVCSRLGVDAGWLQQQAQHLGAFDDQAIQREARLVMMMLRDQLRVGNLEQELNSLTGQLSNTYEELSLIYQLSSGMKINRRASEFFKQACLDVMEVMSVRGMGVALRGDDLHQQEPVLYGPLSLPPGTVHRLAEQLIEALSERKSPLLVNNLAQDKTFGWLAEHAQQLIAVPLQRQDQVLGCMFGLDKLSGEFDTVDSKLLNSIANESAIYLENAMLFEDVRGLMMGLLHALISAVDAKDTYTCGHSERVALLSRRLAKQAQLSDHEVERIYMAGLLHDVGKIGVPEAVLQKAGRLTDEEFAEIKKHPEIGARILRDIKQIEDIIPGVMHHHERWDGRGYPCGLAGEDIPLMGRIICLADCFDAMTSSRTYRKALPFETALEEIRRCAGTQFDPGLAEAFLQIPTDEIRMLMNEHQSEAKRLINLQRSVRPTAATTTSAAAAGGTN
jgi:putative nucleotidyltransferase with HDIG domain